MAVISVPGVMVPVGVMAMDVMDGALTGVAVTGGSLGGAGDGGDRGAAQVIANVPALVLYGLPPK